MRGVMKVALVDLVLVLAAFAVYAEESWRLSYAPHSGLSGSYSYTFLSQFFTLSGGSIRLVSPPTLSWLQVIAVLLAILNLGYLYDRRQSRRGQTP